jgi:hypothetical protein
LSARAFLSVERGGRVPRSPAPGAAWTAPGPAAAPVPPPSCPPPPPDPTAGVRGTRAGWQVDAPCPLVASHGASIIRRIDTALQTPGKITNRPRLPSDLKTSSMAGGHGVACMADERAPGCAAWLRGRASAPAAGCAERHGCQLRAARGARVSVEGSQACVCQLRGARRACVN